MERKIWARTKGSNLYPNLYLVLVGPPGIGKSNILSMAERLLREVPLIKVAPSSLTTASLVDTLNGATRGEPAMGNSFNSLQVIASELGVFMPEYSPSFMNTLQKLYDCETYEERRRTGKTTEVNIARPQLSILGGTTPSYLSSFLPQGAWDQGFTSRTIFIYSGQAVEADIWAENSEEAYTTQLQADILYDLHQISEIKGKIDWTGETMTAISAWQRGGRKPEPDHPRLMHYNSRRLAHVLKLSMAASLSRSNELVVRIDDYSQALNWLLEAEEYIPEIFKSGYAGDSRAIEEVYHLSLSLYNKNGKKPIMEQIIVHMLTDRVQSGMVLKVIEIMVRSGYFTQTRLGDNLIGYIPALAMPSPLQGFLSPRNG